MERPSEFPEPDHPLLKAARYNDAQAEEVGLPATVGALGMDLSVLTHVAEQRALRMVLIHAGRLEELHKLTASTNPTPVELTPTQRKLVDVMAVTYLDGIALGWKAHELTEFGS